MAFNGPLCRLEIDCGFPLVALVTTRSAEEMGLETGPRVFATIKAVSIHVIKRH
jgi:molybdate transport system ATP-binding protein